MFRLAASPFDEITPSTPDEIASLDGEWVQVREPSENPRGKPTGVRKDGGHPKGPKHPDSRGWEAHGHVPEVLNPDGTPWLPIYQ